MSALCLMGDQLDEPLSVSGGIDLGVPRLWARVGAGGLRIGLISQWYAPEPGAAQVPTALASQLVGMGAQVRVLTGFPNYPSGTIHPPYSMRSRMDEHLDGVGVRRVPLYPSHGARALGRVLNYGSFALSAAVSAKYLDDSDGLWIYNSPATVEVPVRIAKRRSGARTLLHIMDLWPESIYAAGFKPPLGRIGARVLDRLLALTYESATEIAYISPSVGSQLADRGVPQQKLHYVPLWANEKLFSPREPDGDLAAELGLEGKVVLLYAGALGEAQGIGSLLEACAMVSTERLAVLIAGSGTAERRLRRLADELGLANVHFLGAVGQERIAEVMAIGDVHLVSLAKSTISESTLPSKFQATLASGRPMIAVGGGDLEVAARASDAAWCVPAGDTDALAQAIDEAVELDRPALRALGQNAYLHYLDVYSLERGANHVLTLLGAGP